MDSVTVLTAVRDGAAYLDAAIRSVRDQTLTDFEFLIVDDGSVDRTPDILAAHAAEDSRIRVLTQPPLGRVVALNRGLEEARGALVARLDSDDIALPHRLARQREVLAAHPEVALLGSLAESIDEGGEVLGVVGGPALPKDIREALTRYNPIVHSTVTMRRVAALEAGGYRVPFETCEDYDLWLRIAERHPLMNLQEILAQYRCHPAQTAQRRTDRQRLAAVLARRCALIRAAGEPDPADGAERLDRKLLHRAGFGDSAIAEIMDPAATHPRPARGNRLTRPLRRALRPLARAALRRMSRRDALGPKNEWARRPLSRAEWGRDRIFALIPSYRDRECQWTIRDMFEKARHPDRISAGVVWQMNPAADADCFQVETRPEQVRTMVFPPRASYGCSWARHQGQRLWEGEEYTLQIDSHMRFVQDWDVKMIGQLARCDSPRPLLTTRPLHYDLPSELAEEHHAIMTSAEFDDMGILHVGGALWTMEDRPDRPVQTAFASGGFIFGPSQRMIDAPYDPHTYFIGEEINLSVRLWTAGWDFFMPDEILIYHHYAPSGTRSCPWDDDPEWHRLHKATVERLQHLFGMAPATDPQALIDIDRYGLGRVRSLTEWEAFAGINFAARHVSDRARQGVVG